MGNPKGVTGNPNGRPKGSQNKVNKELRATIQGFIDRNIETIQADYDQLEPNDRLKFMEKLFSYAIPKLQAVNQTITFDQLPEEQLDKIIEELSKQI